MANRTMRDPRRVVRCAAAESIGAALLLGMLVTGCAATRAATSRLAPARLPTASELDAALSDRRTAVQSLRALAHLRYRDADESGSSREALIVARPDRVRVEVLSVLGSVFVLTADNGAMTAYARQDDTVYRGKASLENLARYARLWVPVTDLVDIVLGTPPPRPAQQERVTFDADANAVRLWRALDDGVQVVWFTDAALPVAAEERASSGDATWRATFDAYEEHAGVPVATRIALELPGAARRLEITLDDVDVNPSLDHSVFAFQTPPGSKVVNLDRVAD